MNENPELRITVPVGNLISLERFPIGTKRASSVRFLHVLKNLGALGVVLRHGFLPNLIDSGRILRGGGRKWIAALCSTE